MLSFMIATVLAAGSADAPSAEALSAPMPPGFVSAFVHHGDGRWLEERVPKSETVERWTRIVTIQRFTGGARIGAGRQLDRLRQLMQQACVGAVASPVATAADGSRLAASVRVDCPSNPQTSKPETMFARAIEGESDLYVVQYAYRAVPGAAEAKAAEDYLAAVAVCPGAPRAFGSGGC